jgi:hypothetical protein
MNRVTNLRIPLAALWPDIRVPGLPVWHPDYGQGIILAHNRKEVTTVLVSSTGVRHKFRKGTAKIHRWYVDLSRPMASDVLARRLNKFRYQGFRLEERYAAPAFICGIMYHSSVIPTLADLDPTCQDGLDWDKLKAPRTVDLIALGLVSQHVYRMRWL